jgi:hypothetical protein
MPALIALLRHGCDKLFVICCEEREGREVFRREREERKNVT